jgi:hypothetical protein
MKLLNGLLFLWVGLVRRCVGVPIQLTVNQRGSECLYEQLNDGYVQRFVLLDRTSRLS